MWTLKDLVNMFNVEQEIDTEKITYYFLRLTVEEEKHIFKVGDTAGDKCRCENVKIWSCY